MRGRRLIAGRDTRRTVDGRQDELDLLSVDRRREVALQGKTCGQLSGPECESWMV